MNEKQKYTNHESEESRSEGYDGFVNLMRRLGVDHMTLEQRLDWLRGTKANIFLKLLSRANGRLANVGRIQRWTGKATKSIVGFAGNTDSPDLEPPENAEEQFVTMYEQMQKEITFENMKLWAAKFYIAIVFAHMFPNGNGRTARHSYALLTKSGMPEVKLSKSCGKNITELCQRISITAMQSVFKNHRAEWNDQTNYATIDGISMGNMDFLKFLAAKEVLQEDGQSNDPPIELTKLTSEQKRKFNERYDAIRKEWYAETLRVVDEYPEYMTQQLDEVLSSS